MQMDQVDEAANQAHAILTRALEQCETVERARVQHMLDALTWAWARDTTLEIVPPLSEDD